MFRSSTSGCHGTQARLTKCRMTPRERLEWLKSNRRFSMPDAWRAAASARYGEAAAEIRHAEAFEITEYGFQPDESEIRRLVPFFPE